MLSDLRIPSGSRLDPPTLRRLAEFSSANMVMWGQFLRVGDEIRFDATLQDVKSDRAASLKAEAANEGALLGTVTEIATSLRQQLAFPPDIVEELRASSARPSSQSLAALRYYNEGLQLRREGKHGEALHRFKAATQEDPNFALAYLRLAQTHATLGYDDEAGQVARRAMELTDGLPLREKYLVEAGHARIVNDTDRAVVSYENLLKAAPDDAQVRADLARMYEDTGVLDKARDLYSEVVARDGNYIEALYALGRIEIRLRNPQGSLVHLNRALSLAIQIDSREPKANILNAIGIAYKRLNKPQDALRYYTESLDLKRLLGAKGPIASTLNELAQVQLQMGKPDEALKAYREALQLRREIGDTRGTGNSLLDLGVFHFDRGDYAESLRLYRESLRIWRQVGDINSEALTLNNIGATYLAAGQYEDARTNFELALRLREKSNVPAETALVLQNLGTTSTRLGSYDEALGFHIRALELWRTAGDQRQTAIEAYRMAQVFERQGRLGAAVESYAEALQVMRTLERDPALPEIMGSYGSTLSRAGNFAEASKMLSDALDLSKQHEQDSITAYLLILIGRNNTASGDVAAAREPLEQALKIATTLKDRGLTLAAQLVIERVNIQQHKPQLTVLRALAKEADVNGQKFESIDAMLDVGAALVAGRKFSDARTELTHSLTRAERLGARGLQSRAHALLALACEGLGLKADASRHTAHSARYVEEIARDTKR